MGIFNARAMARDILGPDADDAEVTNLAWCLYHNGGVYRVTPGQRRSVAVLYAPTLLNSGGAPSHTPVTYVFVGTNPKLWSASDVAGLFTNTFGKNVGDERPLGYQNTWIPVAVKSAAPVPLGGVTRRELMGTTGADDDAYDWYQPGDRPGRVIYRLTSDRRVTGFVQVPLGWLQFEGQGLIEPKHATQRIQASGVTEWAPDDELAAMTPPLLAAA